MRFCWLKRSHKTSRSERLWGDTQHPNFHKNMKGQKYLTCIPSSPFCLNKWRLFSCRCHCCLFFPSCHWAFTHLTVPRGSSWVQSIVVLNLLPNNKSGTVLLSQNARVERGGSGEGRWMMRVFQVGTACIGEKRDIKQNAPRLWQPGNKNLGQWAPAQHGVTEQWVSPVRLGV